MDGGGGDGAPPPPTDGGRRDTGGGGSCAGVDCSDMDDDCNMGVCNPATGACEQEARADGTTCDDGDACTTGDACTAGSCGGTALDCSGMTNACNVGMCNAATGACVAMPRADGTACDDTYACTMGDVCTAGTCAGAMVDCSSMTNMCNVGMCDPATGACAAMPVANGTACSDGSACTTGDVCTGGACGGPAVDCSSMTNACNTGTCNPATGACTRVPVMNGTPCDDMVMCTTGDVCTAGTCGDTGPIGGTCGDAVALPSAPGTYTVTGSTSACYPATVNPTTCATTGGGGHERIYTLTLAQPRRVQLETLTTTGQYDTVLYIRSATCPGGTEVSCNDDIGGGSLLSRIDTYLAAGTYYVFVDGFDGSEVGNYSLQLIIDGHDTCTAPATIAIPASGAPPTVVTDSTTGATSDYAGTCGTSGASPDHVYQFTLTSRRTLKFETTTTAGQYDTVLYLRNGACASGTEIGCNDDVPLGVGTSLSRIIVTLQAGTYYLFVDGYSGASGNYRLEASNVGHAVLIGHDYFETTSPSANMLLGNSVLLANTGATINILEYTQYSDNSAGGEAANARSVINAAAAAAGRTVAFTALTDYTALSTAVAGKHVVLIHEQEVNPSAMATVAPAMAAALQAFMRAGGILVVCDTFSESWRIMSATGFVTTIGPVSAYPSTASVVSPFDLVALGATSPYATPNASVGFNGTGGGTRVVQSSTGAPIVMHGIPTYP